ncbi:hypothetical protein KHC23_03365 [Ancylobacter dichloromethanicus]|uniref:Uncharacterized protein n=1 Tax=Ancylobacter dichloromethanicus TaxID=518825 RepID=A0A9W6JA31_9HYPH|nr:hypothetical protein [Ancylobacter dichloromethanicus]MBS7552702.1 hypothetical protein [Ancylobacter dichloromethanicus]GLK72065.1 hypothetical protein GCM10017643_21810 [Ancylobacter dichloromethanicus]
MARETSDEAVIAYKTILAGILDNRPSGTRQRLAAALGKHRSFVTQVTSPGYDTPLPARHLPTILRVCHFSPAEQERFLAAYQAAHPGRLSEVGGASTVRTLALMVPDFGDEKKNRGFDDAVSDFVARMAALVNGGE